MDMKKGQGLSLNVIIIAAIALVVMVVLIMVFTGKTSDFVDKSGTCGANGGNCVDADECTGGLSKVIDGVCKDDDAVCCLTIGTQ